MTAPRPRRWFQIHLSTAIVLMFVAGGLLYLNLRIAKRDNVQIEPLPQLDGEHEEISSHFITIHTWNVMGWPWVISEGPVKGYYDKVLTHWRKRKSDVRIGTNLSEAIHRFPEWRDYFEEIQRIGESDSMRDYDIFESYRYSSIALNVCTLFLILFGIAFVVERLIRRREARKP